ncbi:hypothetical protein CDAR_433211 [Caerostris darwini]|uniref:Uncharacterized protein n=1 Tax=Caerostris darwini TaxID=1538125 RepID=A0AAV4QK85_9ARAC|nr:hypothetical protein CDAR_433211 [Caerostris darwini]
MDYNEYKQIYLDLSILYLLRNLFSTREHPSFFPLLSLALPQEDHHSTPLGRHEKRNKELFSFVVVDLRAKLFSDWMDEKQDGVLEIHCSSQLIRVFSSSIV